MKHRGVAKAGTGLGAGALLTAPLIGIFALGSLVGIPTVPFAVFEWFIRVMNGRLIVFGLALTLRVLNDLGFNIKNTAKTAEQVLALTAFFAVGLIIGLLFFLLARSTGKRRITLYGLGVGAVAGIFFAVVTLIQRPPITSAGEVESSSGCWGFFFCGAGASLGCISLPFLPPTLRPPRGCVWNGSRPRPRRHRQPRRKASSRSPQSCPNCPPNSRRRRGSRW